MNALLDYWPFLILLLCAGMHLFGHGHRHGHQGENRQGHRHPS